VPLDAATTAPALPLGDAGLSVDGEGRFLHDGTAIAHPGLLAALWRGLAPGPGGGWVVRIGREAARVAVDETPWAVRGVAALGEPPTALDLLLTDGSVERLDPLTLQVGPDGLLRCRVKAGQPARFTRAGQLALGALLEEAPAGAEGWQITLGGVRHRVVEQGARQPTPPE
jgi:hypothetical protein